MKPLFKFFLRILYVYKKILISLEISLKQNVYYLYVAAKTAKQYLGTLKVILYFINLLTVVYNKTV